ERRARREAFVEDLLATVVVYPLTTDIARLAGRLDAEQQGRGIVIPFADLLIGTTAGNRSGSAVAGPRDRRGVRHETGGTGATGRTAAHGECGSKPAGGVDPV